MQKSGWQWPFIAFVQHQWLMNGAQLPASIRVTAQKRCLEGVSLAITGKSTVMPRHVLEELIVFFGGKVVASVSSDTTYLIVGKKHIDGQSVEAGAKYAKARRLDIPLLSVEELLDDLRGTSEEGEQDTFVFGMQENSEKDR